MNGESRNLKATSRLMVYAGTETASGVLGRIIYQLALHQDVQSKFRAELAEARDYPGQELPYDKLEALSYLSAICKETLRL